MAKFQSPLLGYNNNVRHKNRVFHIQTEDSGVGHPHIITHLFMDGGRILKSVKTSYAEHVGTDGMKETVRGMMKEQHKAMFIALRDGQYDHIVDPGAAAAAAAAAAAKPAEAKPSQAPPPRSSQAPPAGDAIASEPLIAAAMPLASEPTLVVGAPVPSTGPTTNPDPPRIDAELPPNTIDESKRPVVEAASAPPVLEVKAPPTDDVAPPAPAQAVPAVPELAAAAPPAAPRVVLPEADAEDVPTTTRQPAESRPDAVAARAASAAAALNAANVPRVSPSGRELTLDFDALERSTHEAPPAPSASLFNSSDLPPPPKNLFAAKEPGSGGVYRAVEPAARHDPREEEVTPRNDPREEPVPRKSVRAQPAVRREESSPPGRAEKRSSPAARPPSDARYAPARPAAIFASTQRPQPQSLFSDELVSDKSLDEVILSYLAEDLEPPRRK